jgi:ribosome-associated translation inhibitor RaiA
MTREQTSTDITSGLVYQTFGSVPTAVRGEAEHMMAQFTEASPRPVVFTRIKVKSDDERVPDQQYLVQGTLDVSGTMVRAQAAAATPTEALRAVSDRLERRLRRLAGERRRATKRPPSTPWGEWHRGDLTAGRPEFQDRPPEERRVVRRKTYTPVERLSVSEAMFEMDVLDYRFYMFTDETDGKLSIVSEEGDGIAIRKIDGSRPDEKKLRPDIAIDETPAPTMDVGKAVSRLNRSAMPFLFFHDSGQHRPSVLYRRYDGHYGLISAPSAA